MSDHTLRLEALASTGLVQALRERGEDDDGVQCGLESETTFVELARGVVREIVEAEAHAAAAKEVARGYRDRAGRREDRAGRLRGALLGALEVLGIRKLTLPEATVSSAGGAPGVVITDAELVPLRLRQASPKVEAAFHGLLRAAALLQACDQPEAGAEIEAIAHTLLPLFEPNRKAIGAELKQHGHVPGAMLGNCAPSLQIRK
jgi:hypothetical protein